MVGLNLPDRVGRDNSFRARAIHQIKCDQVRIFRQTLFGSGAAPKEGKASLDPRQARKVIDGDRGKLPLHELLRCRLRYLTDGYVLGSKEFVKEVARPLESLRKNPVRPRLPSRASRSSPGMCGSQWG